MIQESISAQQTNDSLQKLKFTNRFVHQLPEDPDQRNVPRRVNGACYTRVHPKTMNNPQLVAYAKETAALLELSPEDCESDAFLQVFVGNQQLSGMDTYATCYGGHQFGHWAGQLGDGRAINLGEIINGEGEYWTLQLKGAGPTPYSRSADGFAVLRSSVREFLCSEAMFHLGIPTTRALSLILTGEHVLRDMFYDGNPQPELGAIVCRVAQSFTRFGHFQIFMSQQNKELLQKIVDFTIVNDFPHLPPPSQETYLQWFEEVCQRTATMIVHWMRVGFVHGVMNTDNMSILGQTIDYGPYGWLENYDPTWTPNITDAKGRRYRFEHQPEIAYWNLAQLAHAISPLIDEEKHLQEILNQYPKNYQQQWLSMLGEKIGLRESMEATDDQLLMELHQLLQLQETDMTIFYRTLSEISIEQEMESGKSNRELVALFEEAYYQPQQLNEQLIETTGDWLRKYHQRLQHDSQSSEERKKQMQSTNPKYVLRNYLAQEAIEQAENGDFSMIHELLEVLRHPYEEQFQREKYAQKRPEWARHKAGSSMLSCSS